jgi:aspartate carbamoyltransferase catalytic subunit
MPRHVLSVHDLSDEEVTSILRRATELEAGEPALPNRAVAGLLFGQTSLRTRVGYAAAASRLGWSVVDVAERRHDHTSMIESWSDTFRTLSGYLDVLVARPGVELDRDLLAEHLDIPFINGGSVGTDPQHPSQALIDLHTIDRLRGPVAALDMVLVGDMGMRAARSLIALLSRFTPKSLTLVTAPGLGEVHMPASLAEHTTTGTTWPVGPVDVLYVVGIPHRAIPEDVRDTLRVTPVTLRCLAGDGIVLSPLPVIDEIDDNVRQDPRVRMFEQSDLGLYVRMALLEWVVGTGSHPRRCVENRQSCS